MTDSANDSDSARGTDVPGLVQLDPDHPGFLDRAYRARRDDIASLAHAHRPGEPAPTIDYTDGEHALWRTIRSSLDPLHDAFVCTELNVLRRRLDIDAARVPQLEELNPKLEALAGSRLEPVAGLVDPRTFLTCLGRGVLLSTQYLRHPSLPFYTPEPDAVHELVGHAASLAHPGVARANQLLGRAATVATETEMLRLERVYWYALEFGLALEAGEVRAFGAGILSSVGELAAIQSGPEHLTWDLDSMAETPYDPTHFQSRLFVAPSFDELVGDLIRWLGSENWRDQAGLTNSA